MTGETSYDVRDLEDADLSGRPDDDAHGPLGGGRAAVEGVRSGPRRSRRLSGQSW